MPSTAPVYDTRLGEVMQIILLSLSLTDRVVACLFRASRALLLLLSARDAE